MRRGIIAVAAFGLLVAACGGSTVESTLDTVPTSSSTVAPSTTEAIDDPATSTTTDPPETTSTTSAPVVVKGPHAPDFTLVLGEGKGEFVLSAEQKPVYMVFWAEW